MKLKEYRLKNKLTQAQVGALLNKTGTGYGYYESGKNEPDIKTLITLAEFYHTTIDDLVGRQPENMLNKNLISDTERKIIDIMEQLTTGNLNKLMGYASALLENQVEK